MSNLNSNQIYDSEIPEEVLRVKDPHHGGISEWCFYKNDFWIRSFSNKKWTLVGRSHLTPARVKTLYSLLPKE